MHVIVERTRFFKMLRLPDWLRTLMLPPVKPTLRPAVVSIGDALMVRARAYLARIQPAAPKARNNQVFNVAGNLAALRGEGGESLAEAQILALVAGLNLLIEPPLSEKELRQSVASAMKNGRPREPKPPISNTVFRIKRGVSLRGREVCNVD